MQRSSRVFLLGFTGIVCSSVLSASCVFGAQPVLKWNGGSGGVWDTSTVNWLDEGEHDVVWQPGAAARFEGTGGLVNLSADVSASNLVFAANGYTLLGSGRLTLAGMIESPAAATNSVVVDLVTTSGLAKTGSGALALARCPGPLVVQEGMLIISGSLFADADIAVAAGATLVTLGEPDASANLLLNSGFEDPVLANGAWAYRDIPSWTRTAYPGYVGMKNTGAAGEWALPGTAPEGVQMALVQGGGALSQTVTVPTDGLYVIAFSYMMRNQTPAKTNQVYVSLSGVQLAAFVNRSPQLTPGRFASGALWLSAGSYTATVAGEPDNGWADCTTLIDAVRFAPPSAVEPCRAIGGDSTLALVTDASVILSHGGAATNTLVTVNGAALPGGFTYDATHGSGIFSGPGSLVAQPPEYVFTQTAAGDWDAIATWQNNAAPASGGNSNLLLRLTADAANNLPGNFLARRIQLLGTETATLSGNAITLAGPVSQPRPSTWTISAPVSSASAFTVENTGNLTFSQPLGLATNGLFVKTGSGTLTLAAFTNGFGTAYLYGGIVALPALPATPLTWELYSSVGTPVTLRFTAPGTIAQRINLYGSGLPTVAVNAGGGMVTLSEWTVAFGTNAAFDVAANDTLSLRQLLRSRLDNGMTSAPELLKTGPGTLEIRSGGADADKGRAYPGPTTLRHGTLLLSEDDWGTLSGWSNPFNSRTYSGTGGSLGYNPLTNAVVIGDNETAATDDLAIIANGDGRWIGHDIEVFNVGNTVTLGMTVGTAMFAGTITLHRDITLAGPANGVMVVNTIVAAPDFSGTGIPVLSGLAGLVIENSLSDTVSLIMDGRSLSFGTYAAKAQTLNALVLGSAGTPGTLSVDFGAGANDTLAVTAAGGLVLSNTVINLYYAGSGLPFAEPGTYTLFTYSGTLGGDAALLSVGNPQAGASYAFTNDTANHCVTLTIGNASGGTSYTWKNAGGGAWAADANWDSGTVPNAAGAQMLFGTAITEPSTIALDAAYTVGSLTFNNGSYGYTLAGSSLTLDNGASSPTVSVLSGTHTLDTTLNSNNGGLAVATASGSVLAFGGSAAVNTGLMLTQGTLEMRGNAAVNGATILAPSTVLCASETTNAVIGTLSGAPGSTLTLAGTAAKLTINQATDAAFAGTVAGGADEHLVKAGSGTLTLNGAASPFTGKTSVTGGTLALRSATLASALSVDAPGALEIAAPVTNGLTGFFYNVSPNTNHFWTLAVMESHFATLTPDYAALSGATSNIFDFGVGTPYAIVGPYSSSGGRSTLFEVVWRGIITVPTRGTYVFGCTGDDGYLLAIDGQQILARNFWNSSWAEGSVTLAAGRHDIVLGYFQLTGGGGIRVRVRLPAQSTPITLPSAWLTPYAQTGPLSGSGSLALSTSDSALRANVTSGGSSYKGAFSGVPGSLLAKSGSGILSLCGEGAPNAFAGDIDVQAGVLTFDANERLANTAAINVRSGATLAFAGTETIGSLTGAGTLALGGTAYAVPFTGDADSGFSAAKTYTHLLDFPANDNPATVNGVLFTAAGMSGNAGGYAWSTSANPPTGAWNNTPNDATRSGIDRLLWDFIYGSLDYTITLSDLTPNKRYETRLYFRNFGNNARNVTFSFKAGAHEMDSLYYNPDNGVTGTRSWVGCRYTTDSAGQVDIRILSHVFNDKCHLYGLSNEELTGGASLPVLTLAPANETSASFAGIVKGSGQLIKSGAGTQRFSGVNSLPQPLSVEQGTVILNPGAALPAGATVAAGATLKAPLGSVTLGALTGQGTFALTGAADYVATNGPHFVTITGDADCGVSPDKSYTHLLDFGGSASLAVVNGVTFNKEKAQNGPIFGCSWSNAPTTSSNVGGNTGNIGVSPGQSIYNLLNDFCYGGPYGPTVFYLTGLMIGKTYEVRFYHRKWEADRARTTTFTFDPDGTGPLSDAITFNPDSPAGASNYNDNYLAYRYLAQTNRLAVTITCPNTDKYHCYGLSNEEVPGALDGAATFDIAGDCFFDGTVTGPGALTKTGAGRLTFTGLSDATGPLTVAAGAFGVAEGGRATLGPVNVQAGATLFGHGQMGGNVTIVSDAWLHAGTDAACGTLTMGGDLTLQPGAQLAWRYSAGGASDTVTVNGLLTVPTNGVVQVSTLTPNLMPPAKATLFASPQVINGPAELTGWTVTGVENASLRYSEDHTKIFFCCPRGTLIMLH